MSTVPGSGGQALVSPPNGAQARSILDRPFPANKVKHKRGQGGRDMQYISHGLVTERLNEADPNWTSDIITEHVYRSPDGRMHCEGVTIRLTINGVSRVEAGGPQRQDGFVNEIKNAYSDALKRAAMRFGVALSMWESLVDSEYDEDAHPDYEAGKVAEPPEHRVAAPQSRPQGQTRERAPQGNGSPVPGSGTISDEQIRYMQTLARKNQLDDAGLHAQVNARFGKTKLHDLSKADASKMIDFLKNNDLIDGVPVAMPRESATEAHQRNESIPLEEPPWLAAGEPANDRYTS